MAKRPASLALTATPQTIVSAAFLLYFVVVALGGGSARPDVAALIPVRIAAVLLIVAILLMAPAERLARARAAMIFAGAAAMLVALQLMPLPPALWTALPGRARFSFESDAGLGAIWRPFSLTPDLTINTLLSLLPPAAGALWMRVAGMPGRATALYALAGAGLASAVLGLLQLGAGADTALRYYPITNADSAVGLFANRNHNAMLLAMAIPLLALWAGLGGRAVRHEGVVKSWIALGGAIFLLAMAAITGSRAGIVLAAITGGLAGLIYWQLRRTWPTARRGAVMTAAARWLPVGAVLVVVMLVGLLTQTQAFARLLQTDPLDEQRAQWLAPLSEMAWSFAPVGAGFGSFDSIFRGFEPFELLQTTYLNAAHNDLLQLTIEGGIGGLVLLVVFMLWWGARVAAAWRAPLTGSAIAFARAASVITGTLLLASLFDYPLRTPLLAVVFAVACGWLWADDATGEASKPLPASRD